jgi:hypothetical protein
MRRALLALTCAVALTAALLGTTLSPAGAQSLIIDLGVTVSDFPDPIGPGNGTVYTVTVTNHDETGILTAPDVRLNNTTTGTVDVAQSTLADDSADGQCAVIANVIDCEFGDLAPGASRTIEVVAVSGLAQTSISDTATVSHGPSNPLAAILDQNPDNNTDSEETTVDSTVSTGYVAPGQCTHFNAAGHDHDLCVPSDEENGVIVTQFAGADAEDGGPTVQVDFSDDPDFQAAVVLDLNWGQGPACRGLGVPSGCFELRHRKTIGEGAFVQMAHCPGVDGEPCLADVYKTPPTNVHFVVHTDSDDPEIGPLKFG